MIPLDVVRCFGVIVLVGWCTRRRHNWCFLILSLIKSVGLSHFWAARSASFLLATCFNGRMRWEARKEAACLLYVFSIDSFSFWPTTPFFAILPLFERRAHLGDHFQMATVFFLTSVGFMQSLASIAFGGCLYFKRSVLPNLNCLPRKLS